MENCCTEGVDFAWHGACQRLSMIAQVVNSGEQSMWDQGDYEQVASRIEGLAMQLVDTVERRTGALSGKRVLDLACGTGNASLEAARRGAQVTGVDLAEGLLRQAAAKSQAERLDVRWQMADAAETGLPAGDFDVVMSSVGLIFVTRHATAVAEIARLLTEGGVVAWTAWKEQPDNPFGAPIREFLPAADPAEPTIYDWSDADQVAGWLRDDFIDVAMEEYGFMWRFPDVETPVRIAFEASPGHLASLRELPTSEHGALRLAFEEAFAARRTEDGGVEFPNPYVVVSALKA